MGKAFLFEKERLSHLYCHSNNVGSLPKLRIGSVEIELLLVKSEWHFVISFSVEDSTRLRLPHATPLLEEEGYVGGLALVTD